MYFTIVWIFCQENFLVNTRQVIRIKKGVKSKGHQFIVHVLENKKFVDGEIVEEVAA